jgi:hypothetical protein
MTKRSIIAIGLVLLSFVGLSTLNEYVYAGLFDGSSQLACEGIQIDADNPTDCSEEPTKINSALELAVNLFSLVVGVVAVIMIIVGGLKYVTSNGDSSSISSAKNTIIYAVVGLVIVVLAQAIVRFTVNKTATTPIQEASDARDSTGGSGGSSVPIEDKLPLATV